MAGLNRKEMTVFSANSGVGKSVTMSNLAANFLHQGLNVAYISLELSEDVVAKRFDSIMTGVGQSDIFSNITKIAVLVQELSTKMGRLTITRMPESTTNANHIRAYLKEYERMYGHVPDVLCVDYMDIMTSNNKISAENLFVKDKYIAEELRSIANDFDLVLITASQQNRSGMQVKNDELSQASVAGGISKVNTADNWISRLCRQQRNSDHRTRFELCLSHRQCVFGSLLSCGCESAGRSNGGADRCFRLGEIFPGL